MKIASIQAIPMTFAERRPVQYMFEMPMNFLLVRVDTDEGISGYGEVCDSYGCNYPLVVKAIIDEALSPLLLEEDPLAPGRLTSKMRGWTRRRLGDQGAAIHAISGVEIALWDVFGKVQGRSVSELFGRFRDSVTVYASSSFLGEGPADLHVRLLEPLLSRGVRVVKVRLGLDYRSDLKTLGELRARLGDDIQMMVDGGEHFTVKTALEIARVLADLDIRFFEEPVPQHHREGIARLVEKSPLPIAYGEHLFLTQDFQDCLIHRRADVIQPDVALSGGISECRNIAALGDAFGVPVIPHCAAGPVALAANLHYAACVSNISMLEYAFTTDRVWRAMLHDPILSPERIQDGRLPLPNEPGLGLSINEDIWKQYPYQPRPVEKNMPSWSLGNV